MQLFYGFFAAILDDLRTPSGAGAAGSALAAGALAAGALAAGALAASAASAASADPLLLPLIRPEIEVDYSLDSLSSTSTVCVA